MSVRIEQRVYLCDNCNAEARTPMCTQIPETWAEVKLREPTYTDDGKEVYWLEFDLHYCACCWADGSV